MKIQGILRHSMKNFSEKVVRMIWYEKIRKTALHTYHRDILKAKMVEFAGYDMPVQYFSVIDEHNNCRDHASVFDVSHMGQIRIHGKDRMKFIESVCVSDIKELKNGSATLSLLTNNNGGINDDTIITNMSEFL